MPIERSDTGATRPATGENINKKAVRVRHALLQRVNDEESPFRSWCPVCDRGILLVGRTPSFKALTRVDRCTLCGQVVLYEDDEIAGIALEPPLDELMDKQVETPPTALERLLADE